jgi:hypothetical protein
MTTGDGPEYAATDAHGFQVPRLLRAAEVLCADGRVVRGRVFLPAAAESHPGAMRAEEWMNDAASFVPFLPDGEGRPVILNKKQVAVVTRPRPPTATRRWTLRRQLRPRWGPASGRRPDRQLPLAHPHL